MELDCGISCERITAWLDAELGLRREGDGWAFSVAGTSCHVTATPIAGRAIGRVEIERTLLRADGAQEAADELQRLFILRFASAGG